MDGGWLWYGAWRTRSGEIPLLDFQSYDPGRYYYLAAMSPIFGDGVVGTRESLALLQWIGVSIGLLVLRRAGATWTQVSVCGFALAWWMWPDFKLVDSTLAILTIGVGATLARSPTRRSQFTAGGYAGIAAMFGRNHGVYAIAAFAALLLFLRWKEFRPIFPGAFTAGVVAGYSPMLIAMAGVQGFFSAVMDSVRVNIASRATLSRPIPWPWQFHLGSLSFLDAATQFCTGLCFVAAFAICVATLLFVLGSQWSADQRHRFLLVAALVAATYLDHACLGGDLGHFAQASPTFLLLFAVVLVSVKARWQITAWVGVAVISWFSIVQVHAIAQRIRAPQQWVLRVIDHEPIWMDRPNADVVDGVLAFDRARNPSGEPIFLAPDLPGIYRILRRKSPTWESYFLLPPNRLANETEVTQLASSGARYVILGDNALDNREELRFRNTRPELYYYIRLHYEEMPEARITGSYKVYEKR